MGLNWDLFGWNGDISSNSGISTTCTVPVINSIDDTIWDFHKRGYHQIIHFDRIFHYKLSSYWDIPFFILGHLHDHDA